MDNWFGAGQGIRVPGSYIRHMGLEPVHGSIDYSLTVPSLVGRA